MVFFANAGGDLPAISSPLRAKGRRAWDSSLLGCERWVDPRTGRFSLFLAVEDELRYVWWHREFHVRRESLRGMTIAEIPVPPTPTPNSEEWAFGEFGGEPSDITM